MTRDKAAKRGEEISNAAKEFLNDTVQMGHERATIEYMARE